MKKLLILLSVLLITSSSFAIIEPDDNMMGFYFDLDADTYSVFQVPSFSFVTMYMTLVNPTFNALYGFEVGYTMVGTGQIATLEYTNPAVIDVGTIGNHFVGFGEPTLMDQANVLATLTVFYMDDDGCDPLEFHMHGTDPSSIDPAFPTLLLDDGYMLTVAVSDWDGVTSIIHGDCVVPTTGSTLDSIKSLYR